MGGSRAVGAEDVLNHVGFAIDQYKRRRGLDPFALRELHPRLDSFEELVLDWRVSAYLDRSAYQVISRMADREARQPGELFYAMVGALSSSSAFEESLPLMHAAEHFMQVCEAKGDYSFIYTTAPRLEVPGRRWRPAPTDRLATVLPFHSFGSGQHGTVEPTHISLHDMHRSRPGRLNAKATEFIQRWLRASTTDVKELASRTLQRLQMAGFTGSGDWLELEEGLFFLQELPDREGDLEVVVSTSVRMVHGAPGLLLRSHESDGLYDFCDVGFFLGPVPQFGEPVCVG
jgi:hypothetical protein